MTMEVVNLGSEIKVNIHVDPIDGMTLDDYSFVCYFYNYKSKLCVRRKEDLRRVTPTDYIAYIDSNEIGSGGPIKLELEANLYDRDSARYVRREVAVVNTNIVVV